MLLMREMAVSTSERLPYRWRFCQAIRPRAAISAQCRSRSLPPWGSPLAGIEALPGGMMRIPTIPAVYSDLKPAIIPR
jgi:hypothetical protein